MNKANEFIGVLPGRLQDVGGAVTDVLTCLGITVAADAVNDVNNYANPKMAMVQINGNQYPLKDILTAIGTAISQASKAGKGEEVLYASTTEGSTKKFYLTVDDDGTVTAVEKT